MKKIEFSLEQNQDIIQRYQSNQTLQKIADYYKVSRTVIKRILVEQNIQLRDRTKKYYAKYDIFKNIDSAEKAYWLGFLAADGCNYSREQNASIIINIHQKDIEHLQKFKDFCGTNAEIISYTTSAGFSNNTPMCKIVLNSKQMSCDLSDKGIVPKKSLILKPPKIEEQYYLPFILGYFDGDGSLNKSTTSECFYSLSIQGTKEILEWINSILGISNHLEKRNQNEKNSYYIRCGGLTNRQVHVKSIKLRELPQSLNN